MYLYRQHIVWPEKKVITFSNIVGTHPLNQSAVMNYVRLRAPLSSYAPLSLSLPRSVHVLNGVPVIVSVIVSIAYSMEIYYYYISKHGGESIQALINK